MLCNVMYVCLYVCMYVCMYVCVYVCICVYVYMCIYVHRFIYAYRRPQSSFAVNLSLASVARWRVDCSSITFVTHASSARLWFLCLFILHSLEIKHVARVFVRRRLEHSPAQPAISYITNLSDVCMPAYVCYNILSVCTHVYKYIIFLSLSIYIYIYVIMYMYVCIYIYIYIYIYTSFSLALSLSLYIYIYIPSSLRSPTSRTSRMWTSPCSSRRRSPRPTTTTTKLPLLLILLLNHYKTTIKQLLFIKLLFNY